jgi:tRNA1(Val) A37 N6-methylase TrmN6
LTVTTGTLLGGRVRYDQPAGGYRTGLEPVLLAASVPARPGDRVLEAGCGAGAGLLCLAARVADLTGIGLEIDTALASLAARNFTANGFANLRAEPADVTQWRCDTPFDHAFANPPWHDPAGTASPDLSRRTAKRATPGLLAAWVNALAGTVRARGTLALILPGALLVDAMVALSAARCAEVSVFPLWPHAGAPAKLVILRATRLGKGNARILTGLVLHGTDTFTPEAERVIKEKAVLF